MCAFLFNDTRTEVGALYNVEGMFQTLKHVLQYDDDEHHFIFRTLHDASEDAITTFVSGPFEVTLIKNVPQMSVSKSNA